MTDMRRLITITESYIKEGLSSAVYVPGSPSDPSVDWIKTASGFSRKPGKSLRWEVVPHGNEWAIKAIDGDAFMTSRDYKSAMGMGAHPRFALVEPSGLLSFPEKEDAEKALVDYTRNLAARGYTP